MDPNWTIYTRKGKSNFLHLFQRAYLILKPIVGFSQAVFHV